MILLMADEGVRFGPEENAEVVYVDHGCDWPQTREFVQKMQNLFPITILRPNVQGFNDLWEYLWHYRTLPFAIQGRRCSDKFKVRVLHKYYERPCWEFIGISSEESKRARIKHIKGIETRWPLLERGIDREACKDIIRAHGIQVPRKSGCWLCPFQQRNDWKKLRREHPELYCKALALERRSAAHRKAKGKPVKTLHPSGKTLPVLVGESQMSAPWAAYPPCECLD
jgi:3'-phosphoadenosine 5'-phosphosulfate sulfotransferase (PAPS reductase)/FAD synthetase